LFNTSNIACVKYLLFCLFEITGILIKTNIIGLYAYCLNHVEYEMMFDWLWQLTSLESKLRESATREALRELEQMNIGTLYSFLDIPMIATLQKILRQFASIRK